MKNMEIKCSSGARFGEKTVHRTVNVRTSISRKARTDFTRQCPAYCLPPDFYQAVCVDERTGAEYFLEGFSGSFCELSFTGAGLSHTGVIRDFDTVLRMMEAGLSQERNDLEGKAELLFGESGNRKAVTAAQKDIDRRKRCIETAREYANPDMPEIFDAMHLPWYPGVSYHGSVYELVSYMPGKGYVLENLRKNQYDPDRYRIVQFDALKHGLEAYTMELDPEDMGDWLRMVNNVIPFHDASEENSGYSCFCVGAQQYFAF